MISSGCVVVSETLPVAVPEKFALAWPSMIGTERRAVAGEIEGALEILRPGRQRRHGQDRAEHLAIVRNQNVEIQRRQIVFGRVLRPHGKDGGRNR